MRDIGIVLGNMLRARKYRFAICFRVLSNQYVKRSVYATVFKFNRENKRFERAKVSSRCFHWFPAAMLESLGLQHGVSILNTIIFSDILCRITRVWSIAHPRNFGTLFIYYSSTIFQFLDSIYWIVSDFLFHLLETCVIIKLSLLSTTVLSSFSLLRPLFRSYLEEAYSRLRWPKEFFVCECVREGKLITWTQSELDRHTDKCL